jgi:flagellar biosynthetic protein FliR
MLELQITTEWVIGLALGVTRAAAFVGLCSWIPRAFPALARSTLALALGLLIAVPVTLGSGVGAAADLSTADLFTAAFVNASIGAIMGWFLGLPLQAFQVAGASVDLASGITIGSAFDPESRSTPGPISKTYTLTAQALLFAMGGLMVFTQLLWTSTRVIGLDGQLGSVSGLSQTAIDSVNSLMRQGIQLALPIVSVLFLAELAFGLLNRMAPQINMFFVGIPLKTLFTLSLLGSASVVFPRYVDHAISSGTTTVLEILGG